MPFPLLELLFILVAAFLGGRLAVRLGYPTVLGELAAGILLGPPLLGLLDAGDAIGVMAELGVLLMMLYIGMEIDPRELGKARLGGLLAALGGFVLPFALGLWVVTAAGGTMLAGVFVGMAMGVTSLATKSRILVDLRILDTRIAHVMMAGALIADTISLLIFAGITSVVAVGSLDVAAVTWIAAKVSVFFVVAWVTGRTVLPAAWRWLQRRGLERASTVPLVLIIALAFAEGAHLAGLHGILGTFVAGLVLRSAMGEQKVSQDLTRLVRDISLGFLAPVFFVTAGFEVSFSVFTEAPGLLATVVVLATVGKIVGTALAYLPTGHGWREGLVLGAGMNGRGAVEIIIAGIGLQAGIIDRTIFSILVFMAILTTATVPLFLTWGVAWLERHGQLVRSEGRSGTIIVGAGPLARWLAQYLSAGGARVVLVDRNAAEVAAAREDGLTVVAGDVFDADVLREAGVDEAGRVLAVTANPEVNVLAVQRAREQGLVPGLMAALSKRSDGGLFGVLDSIDAEVAFSRPTDVRAWDEAIRAGRVRPSILEVGSTPEALAEAARRVAEGADLPLVIERAGSLRPFAGPLEAGDRVTLASLEVQPGSVA